MRDAALMAEPEMHSEPEAITTHFELVQAFRHRQGASGNLSVRQISRRTEKAAAQRQGIVLSSSSVGAYLKGDRVPGEAALDALLRALDVPPEDLGRWQEARKRTQAAPLAPHPQDPHPQDPHETTPAVEWPDAAAGRATSDLIDDGDSPSTITPRRRRDSRKAVLIAVLVAVTVLASAAGWYATFDREVASIHCSPASCTVTSPDLVLTGKLTTDGAEQGQPYILTYAEGMQSWYLASSVNEDSEGRWTARVGVGSAEAQPKDRHFTVCLWLLPTSSIASLTERQIAARGAGLAPNALPEAAQQLACTPARRLKGT
jgi:hypothetical protein